MKYIWSFFILSLYLISCSNETTVENEKNQGGIIFTFDDQYVDDWHHFRNKFREYNIKATFFINRPQNLTNSQIEKLKQLARDGHEIGSHGLNHKNALDFKDAVKEYYLHEVKPAVDKLDSMGFEVQSFAYPHGKSTGKMDSSLLNFIPYLRKATWNIKDTTIDYYNGIYANAESFSVINSMGIDNNYHISLESIEKGIERAKKNNEVLIFHGHRIDTAKINYAANPDYLEKVFRLSNKHGLKSIRICDLKRYFKDSPDDF